MGNNNNVEIPIANPFLGELEVMNILADDTMPEVIVKFGFMTADGWKYVDVKDVNFKSPTDED